MMGPTEPPVATRYSLLSRLRNWGDQEGWREFFELYWPLIYSAARRAGLTDAEAQDVVQETVLSVAKNIEKFRRDRSLGSFRGWLRNLVRWRIGDQLRQRGSAPAGEEPGRMPAAGPEEPEWEQAVAEEVWETDWRAQVLAAATARVKLKVREEHFQVFDLVVLQGVPVDEVTQRLGVSRAAVYLVKHRVARLVRKQVQELEKRLF